MKVKGLQGYLLFAILGGFVAWMIWGQPKINVDIESYELKIQLLEKKIDSRTLGEYLNSLLPPFNESYQKTDVRVRNRFVRRDMYISEAHLIWNSQVKFHNELNDDLRDKLIGSPEDKSVNKGAVFYQKPLSSQKHKVGKCAFEPNKSRCSISNLVYQDLLAYKWGLVPLKKRAIV